MNEEHLQDDPVEEREEEGVTSPSLPHPYALGGATFATIGAVDLLAHLGPTGLLVGAIAGIVAARHGSDLYDLAKGVLSPLAPLSQPAAKEDVAQPVGAQHPSLHQRRGRSVADRLLGRFPDTLEEEEETTRQPKGAPDPHPSVTTMRDAVDAPRSPIPRRFVLSGLTLESIRAVNAQRCVYFGETAMRQVVIRVDDMYHVIDVDSSGKGKSNRFRLAMMQVVDLAETYFINPLANNVKAVNDSRTIEVWKPIFDRLANKRPVKDGTDILQLMTALVSETEKRNSQEASGDFSWREHPIFVFIDELPEVFVRCPEAALLLDKIGRTGRQFCIFSWVASQTAAVKDIGQSIAAQANYKTRIYGGGDRNSSGRLMKGSIPMEHEQALQSNGAGLTLMLADGFSTTEFVRAPLVTNEALFAYFGLPPFTLEEWLAPRRVSKQPVQRLDEPLQSSLSPFSLFPKEDLHAQKSSQTVEEKGKGKSGKRGKLPNEDAILEAMDALEAAEKALTLHAIAKRAGLTRHQYEDIEAVAIECGYELDRGKGRPPRTDHEREA